SVGRCCGWNSKMLRWVAHIQKSGGIGGVNQTFDQALNTDYQLAAFAAALSVLTQYSEIEGINIENELYREKQKGQKSEFDKLIDQAVEIAYKHLVPGGFDASVVRHALFAVHETIRQESAQQGVNYLKTELKNFWNERKKLIEVLRYLSRMEHIDHLEHWEADAEAAKALAGALENTNG
uniref:hypothetical protein n=2 Tax=unclassified Endozoicomonas TaxID=2644528 RepID=UPI0021498F7B